MLSVLALVAVVVPAAGARSGHASRARSARAVLQQGILQQLNALRASHHLKPLTLSPSLNAVSLQHTKEMAARGYFAHDSADGSAFWKRIRRVYGVSGYSFWSVGENLLWQEPNVDPAAAIRLWLASPEHKRNMLDPRWREIGIAAVHVDAAPGVYGGQPVTIVTTDFGVRR